MAFEFEDIPEANFNFLNSFFQNGFKSNKLLEYSQKINLQHVDIISNEWYFDGIRMAYSSWIYEKPIELNWHYDINVELITFIANLKGTAIIGNKSDQKSQILGSYQHNLFYSQPNEIDKGVLRFKETNSSMFIIQFTKETFLRLTRDANEVLNRFGENIINGKVAILSPSNLPLDVIMQNIIKNIVNCAYKDGLKKMFLLSKSIEFLVLQAEACNLSNGLTHSYIKTNYDKDCILYARECVMNRLETPPSLSELARIVGINEYKLKRGFKEMFGTTVFGYLSDARLEIAKNDIMQRKKSISEIAMDLGYSSVQHFSLSFKKKYGYSPTKLES
jgi:AraC family transcriptional regulator, transcriptional activator of the genes for pyochelin and ferripyochelin receptors